MPNFDNMLGIHEAALRVRAQRMEVLASNLANSDTPNYKARDIDFRKVLREANEGRVSGEMMKTTHHKHIQPSGRVMGGEALYRNPLQPSVDGNTVDPQIEKSKFMENALQYQASINFIDGRISSLRKAIRGE